MDSGTILSGRILLVGPPDITPDAQAVFEDDSWHCLRAHSLGEAMWRLRNESAIDVVLIAPGRAIHSYIDLCRHMKFGPRNTFVSVVFILEPEFGNHRIDAYQAGADDCIQLPAPRNEIVLRLMNAIRATRASSSLEDATTVITALANAIEGKDEYTCGHVERVATYSVEIGKRVGVDAKELSALRKGALVHDIGKVAVPDHVLNKPGKLTDEEMDIVRRHPIVGYEILQPLRTFQDVLPIVRWHHERPNGGGYPDGLTGDELPLLPRIVAVADCFDALNTDRPYRRALAFSECIDILSRGADDGDLDRDTVATLLEMVERGASSLAEASA